jgi:hypothetical protein
MSKWIRVCDRLPSVGDKVLIANKEGIEVATYHERCEDDPQQPGHDAGFIGTFAWPGRSWGPSLQSEPQGQPLCWMEMPEYPDLERDEFEMWWNAEGEFIGAGQGEKEKRVAFQAWEAARRPS